MEPEIFGALVIKSFQKESESYDSIKALTLDDINVLMLRLC